MTRNELQTFMLKNRLSVEMLFRMTGHKPNDIRGYLKGNKKIPWFWTEESLKEKIQQYSTRPTYTDRLKMV